MHYLTAALITAALLAGATTTAFARWGTPAPTWFAHSCASPGARLHNANYCAAKSAAANKAKAQHAG
jgi:hypothetical protein